MFTRRRFSHCHRLRGGYANTPTRSAKYQCIRAQHTPRIDILLERADVVVVVVRRGCWDPGKNSEMCTSSKPPSLRLLKCFKHATTNQSPGKKNVLQILLVCLAVHHQGRCQKKRGEGGALKQIRELSVWEATAVTHFRGEKRAGSCIGGARWSRWSSHFCHLVKRLFSERRSMPNTRVILR